MHGEARRRGMVLHPDNSLGYFGPSEERWRGAGTEDIHWAGCLAGRNTMGIESDGTVKSCPSLPTAPYAGGRVTELPLERIWAERPEIAFTRRRTQQDLWGFCGGCYYADVCRGGCRWMGHVLFGRPGNNPFCHRRALELARQGMRERVELRAPAPGIPYDHGRFALVVEPLAGSAAAPGGALAAGLAPRDGTRERDADRLWERPWRRERLEVCGGCRRRLRRNPELPPLRRRRARPGRPARGRPRRPARCPRRPRQGPRRPDRRRAPERCLSVRGQQGISAAPWGMLSHLSPICLSVDPPPSTGDTPVVGSRGAKAR
jgi:radical SAM protein with 4Fe4S-binding SPASM domain